MRELKKRFNDAYRLINNRIIYIQIRRRLILIGIGILILSGLTFLVTDMSSRLSSGLSVQSESPLESIISFNANANANDYDNDINYNKYNNENSNKNQQGDALSSSSSASQTPRKSFSPPPQILFENFEDQVSPIEFLNATSIFNEIHNLLKQKNSDLNPIGVSYLPVTIPQGTLLYHSSWNGQIPESFEWTALDYEFSYHFIDIPRVKLSQASPRQDERKKQKKHNHYNTLSRHQQKNVNLVANRESSSQSYAEALPNLSKSTTTVSKYVSGGSPLFRFDRRGSTEKFSRDENNQYKKEKKKRMKKKKKNRIPSLFTFQVERPLDKLILLSGASASKLPTGEMDSQFILASLENYDNFDEKKVVEKICNWGAQNGGLDGIVRLEIGYEIVLCDFHNKLKLISNNTLTNKNNMIGFPEETLSNDPNHDALDNSVTRSLILDTFEAMSGFDHYLAGSRVYNGESKIIPDFSKFVTVLNRTYVDPDTYTRRIYNIPDSVKQSILKDLSDNLNKPMDPFTTNDWQLITNRIVSKFGPMLQTLNSSFEIYNLYHHNSGILGQNLTTYTFNYIRRYLSEPTYYLIPEYKALAIWDYVHANFPLKTESDYLIWSSIEIVQESIVNIISGIFQLGRELLQRYNPDDLNFTLPEEELEIRISDVGKKLNILLEQLNWPLFYKCKEVCGADEICFVPSHGPSPILITKNKNLGLVVDELGRKRIDKEGAVCIGYKDLL